VRDKPSLDDEVDRLVRAHGVGAVLAALCRQCNSMGMPTLFRKLNRVYEWLTEKKLDAA
jgi:hypothetical protein